MVSFDPIPNEMWEDWKWFVYPEGHMLGMREGKHRMEELGIDLTPCYVLNLPKLVMSDVMWASRLETSPEGARDTNDYLRPVRVGVDSIVESVIYLLSQNPMVVSRRPSMSEQTLDEQLREALQKDDEMILVGEDARVNGGPLDGVEVAFFNPFADGADPCISMLGVVTAEGCIKELSMARVDIPDSVVRDALKGTMLELSRRGLVEHDGETVVRMTEKGRRLLELEPVTDAMSCRCEYEGPKED